MAGVLRLDPCPGLAAQWHTRRLLLGASEACPLSLPSLPGRAGLSTGARLPPARRLVRPVQSMPPLQPPHPATWLQTLGSSVAAAAEALAVALPSPPKAPAGTSSRRLEGEGEGGKGALEVQAQAEVELKEEVPSGSVGQEWVPVGGPKVPSEMGPEERARYDMEVAEKAVQLACWLTQRVQAQLRKEEERAQSKADKSFVTVADYGVQAVISWLLSESYPGETVSMVAEEDAKDLTGEANVGTLQRLVAVVNECLEQGPRLGITPPARPLTAVEILASISRGSSPGGPQGRHWVLDPVDGTLGFVRQDQYAIALALIEEGQLTLGVLGCPNFPRRAGWLRHPHRFLRLAEKLFPPEGDEEAWTRGVVMKAQRGQGAFMEPLLLGIQDAEDGYTTGPGEGAGKGGLGAAGPATAKGKGLEVKVSAVNDPVAAVFCEPVEKANSNQGLTGQLAVSLGMTSEALRMYSMAKYAAVARGDAEIFMKFAKSNYKEKIWDHAAGVIIVEEAGGMVTDAGGLPLDFSRGRYLDSLDRGIIASSGPHLHDMLLAALEESWESSKL